MDLATLHEAPTGDHIRVEFPGEIGSEVVNLKASNPSDSFLEKLRQYIYDTEKTGGLIYHLFDEEGKKILPQKWSLKDFDDTERGPILLGDEKGGLRNWSGNQHYVPAKEYIPTTLEEAKAAIKEAYTLGQSVTVVGGAYGSSNLASTRGALLNTQHFQHILERNFTEGKAPEGVVQTITVESGIEILNIIQDLSIHKKVLPTSPIFSRMSLGGGLAVGIHGTGRDFHTLPDYVTQVTVLNVDSEGEVLLKTYTRKDNPEQMRALTVNIGALGFVYSITVQVFDMFNIRAVDEHVPWPETEEELAANIKQWVLENDYVELFWWPTTNKLWLKRWNKTTDDVTPSWEQKLEAVNQYFESYATVFMVKIIASFPQWTHQIMDALQALSLPFGKSEVVAPANAIYNYLVVVPPKHWDLNQCIDIPKTAAEPAGDFSFIAKSYNEIRQMVAKESAAGRYPLNTTLHTRFISNSDSYLSPIYNNNYSAMTEVLAWNITSDWLPFFKKVEAMWLKNGGKPHWGKLIFELPERSKWGGGTGMQDFLAVKKQLDPHNVFFNDYHYDIFKRITPKAMTVKVDKVHVHEGLLPSVIHWFKDLFKKDGHTYKVTIVTASDERQTVPVNGTTSINQTFHNITLTNFIEFQLWIDDHLASTAVWHAPMYNYVEGQTVTEKIHFHPNWFTDSDLGWISFEVTPINTSSDVLASSIQESVAIIGVRDSNSPDEAPSAVVADFAVRSAAAGYKVYVNEESTLAPHEGFEPVVASLHDAAKSAPIIVFACPPTEAQAFVKKCGSLVNKVVVDATSYFATGADESHPVDFGKGVIVAKIVEEEVSSDKSNVVISASESGTQQVVAAWLKSMHLTPVVATA